MDGQEEAMLSCRKISKKRGTFSNGAAVTLKEITDKCSESSIREVRHLADEYGEIVVYNTKIDEWTAVFVDLLGPPKKPSGVEPTEDDRQVAINYGGIWANQTLFKKELGDSTLLVMYWPWQDGVHTTVKMARIRD
jgi:hypothetical protein